MTEPHEIFLDMFREYGDFVRWRGLYVLYFVNHPDYVRQVLSDASEGFSKNLLDYRVLACYLGEGLLCAEGSEWQQQREHMQPFFGGVGRFDAVINSLTSSFLAGWETRVSGETVWIDRDVDHLTARITSSIVLGRESRDFEDLIELLPVINTSTRGLESLMTLQSWIPTPHNFKFRAIRRRLDKIAYESIAARRRDGTRGDDILSWLIHAGDEAGEGRSNDRKIRDQIVTFMMSSQIPTNNALVWTLYLLAMNPRVETQLADALTARLNGAPATADDLARLPLLKRVVQESLRLYPPAWILPRRAERKSEFDGYVLPAKAYVGVVPYTLHRNPEFWPDPERFDPDRFRPDRIKSRHFYAYLPFGAGARTCIGGGLAMRQVQLILAQIVQRFKIRVPPEHPVQVQGGVVLTPRNGIPATLAYR